jgi:hypothetical protein
MGDIGGGMKVFGVVAAVLMVLGGIGVADTITLLNGRTIEGQIIRSNALSVTIRTSTGGQTYRMNELQGQAVPPSLAPAPVAETKPADREGVSRILRIYLYSRLGQIIYAAGSVLLLIQGFRISLLWGLLVFFTNILGGVVLLLFHPKRVIVPILIMLAGITLFLLPPLGALWSSGGQ